MQALPRPSVRDVVVATAALAVCAGTLLLARSVGRLPDRELTGIFYHLFLRDEPSAAWCNAGIVVAAVLIGWVVPERLLIAKVSARPLPWIAVVTAGCAVASVFVYRSHPLSMDEYAPYFQAQAFARFSLTGRAPPELIPRLVPPVRWFLQASPSGEIISVYWPGFALLLTPFMWLGCPFLLNPLIGGATLWFIWKIASALWPGTSAPGWAVLLSAASPAFVVNAISYYSMPAHLLASAIFAWLLIVPSSRRILLAGIVGSVALVLHNPLPHALFALPFIGWLLIRPGRLKNVCLLALGYIPLTTVVGVGWFLFQRRFGTAVEQGHSPAELLGYLAQLAFAPPSLKLVTARLINLSELCLWAAPLLIPIAASGAWQRRAEPFTRLLIASALATLTGYFFVPYDQGHGWGFRYFHSAWLVLPLCAAAALAARPDESFFRRVALASTLLALVLANGLRLRQVGGFMDAYLRQLPDFSSQSALQIVFVQPKRGYYVIDAIQNDPFMEGSRWMLMSQGEEDEARFVRSSFPKANARVVARTRAATLWAIE